jgi:hypothetical protein
MTRGASMELRPALCPTCGHRGGVRRGVATSARLRCTACGQTSLVRECIGPRPTRRRRPSRERAMRAAAAREVLQRLGDSELDDRLDDLFVAKGTAAP